MNQILAYKKGILTFLAFLVMGIGLLVSQQMNLEQNEYVVPRTKEGELMEHRFYTYRTENGLERRLAVDVYPRIRDENGAKALLEEAVLEWKGIFLGENTSVDEVSHDLIFPESLCDGLVQVQYESSNLDVLHLDGKLMLVDISKPVLVEIGATFSYEDYSRTEKTALRVTPPQEGSAEWMEWKIARKLKKEEEDSREADRFYLPDHVGEVAIHWKQQKDFSWMFLVVIGAVAGICPEWKEREKQKKAKAERDKKLLFEYPQMVEQLSLLLGSGMTIRKAWEKMLLSEQKLCKYRKPHCYTQEMWVTFREMKEGMGERSAYERFGNRVGLVPYKRLGSILAQSLVKGSQELQQMLQQEAQEALTLRKNHARKLGEEAGTKMLFPMLVMLLLVLVMLIVPALTLT